MVVRVFKESHAKLLDGGKCGLPQQLARDLERPVGKTDVSLQPPGDLLDIVNGSPHRSSKRWRFTTTDHHSGV
jgi:hypothetical protein